MAFIDQFAFERFDDRLHLIVRYDKDVVHTVVATAVQDDIDHDENRYVVYGFCPPEENFEKFLTIENPITWFKTESEARLFMLGYAMVNDLVLVGDGDRPLPSCEKAVAAFADGLQEACFEIGPGGPVFTPVLFPDFLVEIVELARKLTGHKHVGVRTYRDKDTS